MKTRIVLGIPTQTEVKLLLDTFGTPNEGVVIKWEQIEELLRLNRRSSRFNTITTVWRKRLEKEFDILLIAEPGIGLKVSNPSERHDLSHGYYKQSMRRVVRCGAIAEGIDRARLTDEEKKSNDFYRRISGVLRLAANTEAKKLP